jgi:hypothetical protein
VPLPDRGRAGMAQTFRRQRGRHSRPGGARCRSQQRSWCWPQRQRTAPWCRALASPPSCHWQRQVQMHDLAVITTGSRSICVASRSGSSCSCVSTGAGAGAGEPFVTAAGVLGLMAVWRCFYTACEGFGWDFVQCPSANTSIQLAAACSCHGVSARYSTKVCTWRRRH